MARRGGKSKARAHAGPWRPSAPLLVGLLLLLAIGAVAAWLQFTHESGPATLAEEEPALAADDPVADDPVADDPVADDTLADTLSANEDGAVTAKNDPAQDRAADSDAATEAAALPDNDDGGDALADDSGQQTGAAEDTIQQNDSPQTANAAPSTNLTVDNNNRPRIAIVLSGLGFSRAYTSAAIDNLPPEVTLAFAPYGRDLASWTAKASQAGHELLLELPMEPESYPENEPGSQALLTVLPTEENAKRLEWLLGRFSGYIGVINFMGGRFTRSDEHLRPVLEILKDRQLLMAERRISDDSRLDILADEIGLRHAISDLIIDQIPERNSIEDRLDQLEEIAKREGTALGVSELQPIAMEVIAQWSRSLPTRNIELVPLSRIATHLDADG